MPHTGLLNESKYSDSKARAAVIKYTETHKDEIKIKQKARTAAVTQKERDLRNKKQHDRMYSGTVEANQARDEHNLYIRKKRWEARKLNHDPMEVVICKACSHLEYWGKMIWFEGRVLCRECYIREFMKVYGRPPENIDSAPETPSIIE